MSFSPAVHGGPYCATFPIEKMRMPTFVEEIISAYLLEPTRSESLAITNTPGVSALIQMSTYRHYDTPYFDCGLMARYTYRRGLPSNKPASPHPRDSVVAQATLKTIVVPQPKPNQSTC